MYFINWDLYSLEQVETDKELYLTSSETEKYCYTPVFPFISQFSLRNALKAVLTGSSNQKRLEID